MVWFGIIWVMIVFKHNNCFFFFLLYEIFNDSFIDLLSDLLINKIDSK